MKVSRTRFPHNCLLNIQQMMHRKWDQCVQGACGGRSPFLNLSCDKSNLP